MGMVFIRGIREGKCYFKPLNVKETQHHNASSSFLTYDFKHLSNLSTTHHWRTFCCCYATDAHPFFSCVLWCMSFIKLRSSPGEKRNNPLVKGDLHLLLHLGIFSAKSSQFVAWSDCVLYWRSLLHIGSLHKICSCRFCSPLSSRCAICIRARAPANKCSYFMLFGN